MTQLVKVFALHVEGWVLESRPRGLLVDLALLKPFDGSVKQLGSACSYYVWMESAPVAYVYVIWLLNWNNAEHC